MTEAQALHLVCKAALLEDSAAIWFLCEQLEQKPAGGTGKQQLLLALAWLAPEKALVYYQADTSRKTQKHRESYEAAHLSIKRLQEAHQFCTLTPEEKTASLTLTALLPPDSPAAKEKQQVQYLAAVLAPYALENLDAVVREYVELDNPLLLARMWQSDAEFLLRHRVLINYKGPFLAIGQLALSTRASQADIDVVLSLVRWHCRSLGKSCIDFEAQVLIYTLDALETLPRDELFSLMLGVLPVVELTRKRTRSMFMARILVFLVRTGLETDKTLLPLLKHVSRVQQTGESTTPWIEQVEKHIASFAPVPPTAYTLARLLHYREAA